VAHISNWVVGGSRALQDERHARVADRGHDRAMADNSAIEWTDATWNPTTGCDRTSPGCDNCYALTLARRLKAMGVAKYQRDGSSKTSGPGFGLSLHYDALEVPRRWRAPKRVFVNSMSDLFHEEVPLEFIQQVFTVMRDTPQHTYQILTKRTRRLTKLAPALTWPPNVWMGVSIEDDRYVFRARHLMTVPAAVRFLSLEPLIGPLPSLNVSGVDWVIVGGESGKRARPVSMEWIRDLRDQCLTNSVAFFFKQWGGVTPKSGGRQLDGRTWDEYPDLGIVGAAQRQTIAAGRR
jgi:protein gp37